jgi:hypothetical protein
MCHAAVKRNGRVYTSMIITWGWGNKTLGITYSHATWTAGVMSVEGRSPSGFEGKRAVGIDARVASHCLLLTLSHTHLSLSLLFSGYLLSHLKTWLLGSSRVDIAKGGAHLASMWNDGTGYGIHGEVKKSGRQTLEVHMHLTKSARVHPEVGKRVEPVCR